jgi:hypothetical protein
MVFVGGFSLVDNQSKKTLSLQQKSAIADGIILGTLANMKDEISRESPEECAAYDSKKFRKSKTAIAENTISINILTNEQKLPARQRNFRETLADGDKNIGRAELSDALSSIRKRLGLERSEHRPSYPRGRPSSGPTPYDEKRGRSFYYDESQMMQIIDEVLSDEALFKKIDDAVTSSEVFFKYRPFSIEAGLHLVKKQQQAFRNTYKPFIKKNGLSEGDPKSTIKTEDITNEMIKRTAVGSARDTKLAENIKKGIYRSGGRIFFYYILRKHQQQATS